MEEKCFFEINLVCGERNPVPAEELEHAQWLRQSELRAHGVHRRNVVAATGRDVTNAGPISSTCIVFDGEEKELI